MAHFARQKRQTKTYWAELGFMALGLFGLQPGLFTSLLTPSQTKFSAATDPYLSAYQSRPASGYSEYPPTHNTSQLGAFTQQLLSTQAAYNPSYLLSNDSQAYSSQPILSQAFPAGQNAYQATPQFSYNQPSAQTGFSQQSFGQQTNLQSYPQSQNLAAQQNYQQYQQPVQTTYQQNQIAWPNPANYVAQAHSGYSAASSGSGLYANNGVNYQPNSAYQLSSYSGARNNPYSAYEPYPPQQSLFGNGTGSTAFNSNGYHTGSNYGTTSAQNYPYQTANTGGWQRYLAPGSPLYR
ncbi:MAG: hypothetical protein NTY15_17440 [Planctomycetota bacterium]|nr:hypothetical protein [Planctomycetota bacterium]